MAITSLRALLFTAGGVVAVAGVAYFAGAFDRPPAPPVSAPAPVAATPEGEAAKTASGTQDRLAEAKQDAPTAAPQTPAPQTSAPQTPAAPEPATPESAEQAAGGVVAPTFDVLRVEGDGSVVVAGKAEADAKVEILHGSALLGEAKAGADGTFAIVLDDPLKPGDYQLVLRATQPDGVVATSQQTAVVSVPEKADGQVLAMVEEPGKAAELLTVPEPEKAVETPPAPDEPAAGEPAAADTAPEPAEAGQAAVPAAPEQPAAGATPAGPKVVVEAVEIDGSKIFVAGLADAGRKVRVYANDILLGDALASPDGHFLVEATRDVPVGQYTVRVDVLEADGKVASRATVPFDREPGEAISAVAPGATKPAPAEVAAAGQATADPAADAAPPAAIPNVEADKSVPETTAPKLEHADGAVIIRRGDSLWRISRRVYGHGIRYSTIYLANQKQIADPDKIWPGQVFTVPEKSREGEAADLKALGDQATTPPAE